MTHGAAHESYIGSQHALDAQHRRYGQIGQYNDDIITTSSSRGNDNKERKFFTHLVLFWLKVMELPEPDEI